MIPGRWNLLEPFAKLTGEIFFNDIWNVIRWKRIVIFRFSPIRAHLFAEKQFKHWKPFKFSKKSSNSTQYPKICMKTSSPKPSKNRTLAKLKLINLHNSNKNHFKINNGYLGAVIMQRVVIKNHKNTIFRQPFDRKHEPLNYYF